MPTFFVAARASGEARRLQQLQRDEHRLQESLQRQAHHVERFNKTPAEGPRPKPDALANRLQVTQNQLRVVQAKLQLLRAPVQPTDRGQHAIATIRHASLPPLLTARRDVLQGTWQLMPHAGAPTAPFLWMGLGLPPDWSIHSVSRTFCGADSFVDHVGLAKGSVTVTGAYSVANPTTLTLEPFTANLSSSLQSHPMELALPEPTAMPLSFVDRDLLLEGHYDSLAQEIVGWRRYHPSSRRQDLDRLDDLL